MSATAVRPIGAVYGPAPDRTIQQRREALVKANGIRRRRAQLKRDLTARRVALVPLLADPPEFIATMKVMDLLLAVPKLGRVKVGTLLRRAEISPAKTCGGLSVRQRVALCATLRTSGRA